MPIILVVIGLIAALGLGGYFWNAYEVAENDITPVVATTAEVTSTPTETEPETVPTTPAAPTATPVAEASTKPTAPIEPIPSVLTTVYKDADYSVSVTYKAPDQLEHGVTVKLTLKGDIVTASDVIFAKAEGATANYQKNFAATYKTQVIGKSLDRINLARVGGASLTSNAWNNAKAQIAAQAKS